MPRLTISARQRVVALYSRGYSVSQIKKRLDEENVYISKRSLYKLMRKYEETGNVVDRPRRTTPRRITEQMKTVIDEALKSNDELTARQLQSILKEKWPDVIVSCPTIRRTRKEIGWVCTRPHYCQLIRELNKRKRLIWCKEQQRVKEDFKDVIFTDESTIQLEQHSRICFRKKRQPRLLKQRPKHPVKIHVWGGISYRGATNIIMFTGIINAQRLRRVLEAGLLPFIRERYPDGHRLQQDNDPKHASNYIADFFEQSSVNWWPTPPESPDLNPIENVWGSMKQYLRTHYKPRNLNELKQGIQQFWQTLTPNICQRYIGHLQKVIPKVVQVQGEPSGY